MGETHSSVFHFSNWTQFATSQSIPLTQAVECDVCTRDCRYLFFARVEGERRTECPECYDKLGSDRA